jgi:hypothetical protein
MATPGVHITETDFSFIIPDGKYFEIRGLLQEENERLNGIWDGGLDDEREFGPLPSPIQWAEQLIEKYKYHEFIVLQLEEFILNEI